jgi:hypothetical protein
MSAGNAPPATRGNVRINTSLSNFPGRPPPSAHSNNMNFIGDVFDASNSASKLHHPSTLGPLGGKFIAKFVPPALSRHT